MVGSMLLAGRQSSGAPTPGASPPNADTRSSHAPTSTSGAPASTSSAPTSSTPPPATAKPTSTRVVVLDAGHNGGNGADAAEINKQVPAGRGRTKPCNTTGTSTNAGHPEHAFNFDVAERGGAALAAHGIK